MPDEFPKLLVLSSEIPQSRYAGGILLHRLLKGYPPEKLVIIGNRPADGAELSPGRYEHAPIPLVRLHTTRLARLKRSLDAFGLMPQIPLARVRKLLHGFVPEVILSVMQERHANAAWRFARAKCVPLVLIVHDKQELFDLVYPWAKRQQVRANAAVYRSAARRLCISPEMVEHLQELYGAPGEVMYPNRSEELTARSLTDSAQLKHPPVLTVGYAGTLAYGYGSQLRLLAAALRGTQLRLRVYGSVDQSVDPLTTEYAQVVQCVERSATPEGVWERVKAECDAVILPYAWRSQTEPIELYRTHFPSKLPEYLALGMPVVLMGPEFATGVRWGMRHPRAAMVLGEDDPAQWVAGLEKLRQSAELRMTYADAALKAGCTDFNPVQIRLRFLQVLRDAAGIRHGDKE